jgi:tRNA G46 methylase TrmB
MKSDEKKQKEGSNEPRNSTLFFSYNPVKRYPCPVLNPVTDLNNMNAYAKAFTPYNPIIVEIGAYEGEGTITLAQSYPYGKIFAFEPNPRGYSLLVETTQSLKNVSAINLAINTSNGAARLWGDTRRASLFPLEKTHPFKTT